MPAIRKNDAIADEDRAIGTAMLAGAIYCSISVASYLALWPNYFENSGPLAHFAALAGIAAFFVALIVIPLLAITVGVLCASLLSRLRLESGPIYLIAGLAFGTMAIAAFFLALGSFDGAKLALSTISGGGTGLVVAAVWWMKFRRYQVKSND